jgi:hypothetical protein
MKTNRRHRHQLLHTRGHQRGYNNWSLSCPWSGCQLWRVVHLCWF